MLWVAVAILRFSFSLRKTTLDKEKNTFLYRCTSHMVQVVFKLVENMSLQLEKKYKSRLRSMPFALHIQE